MATTALSVENAGYIAITAIFVLLVRLFYNWFSLKDAPGPFLAGTSNLWRAYYQYRGRLRGELLKLHDKHGPIVRYGVNAVSINDPDAVHTIYSGAKGFTIHDSYKVLLGISNGKEVRSLVTIEDETKHGQLRRSVANAFTPTSILEMERAINPTIALLLDVLEQRKVVDLADQMLWYSLDNAGRIAFSEDVGCLKANSDAGHLGRMIRARFNHWGWWSSLPGLERLVYRNPIAIRLPTTQPSSTVARAASKLRTRLNSKELPPESEQDLLHKFMEASRKNPSILDVQGIIGMIMSTISGAADTTASTLVATIYYLHKNPYVLEKLKAELRQANITLPIPDFVETRNLPYLDAVMKESMRIFSVLNWPMERRVPAGGVVIAGTFFPEGTSVGCLPQAMHRNRAVYGEDVDVFRPERWLVGEKDVLKRMESAHLGFSRGKRVCLGQHIAVMQLKKVVPAMVMKFKMSFVDENTVLDADYSPAVVMLKPVHMRLEAIL